MNPTPGHEAQVHAHIQGLIPWYVNGTLDARDRALVRGHLERCPECQREARLHSTLQQRVRATDGELPLSMPALGQMLARVEAHESSTWQRLRRRLGTWLRAGLVERALAAQAMAILLLLALLAWLVTRPEPQPEYRTLGTPAGTDVTAMPLLRLELADALAASELAGLLEGAGARLVYGPAGDGSCLIEVDLDRPAEGGAGLADRLRWLSGQPGVLRAEVFGTAEPSRP